MILGEVLTKNAPREKIVFNRSGKGADHSSENQSFEVFTSQPNPPFPKQSDSHFFLSGQIIFIIVLL